MKRWMALAASVGLLLCWLLPTPAIEQEAVQRSVDRGVRFLKGSPDLFQQHQGMAPLVGLALLECGVQPDDPAIVRIIKIVHDTAPTDNQTYSLCLSILFLDRLGDPGDVPLIESLALRVMAGQDPTGGWGYHCPQNSETETRRLTNLVNQRRQLLTRSKTSEGGEKPLRRTEKDLSPEIRAQLTQLIRMGPQQLEGNDNSNTQFATLALWVARKQGMPVDAALIRVDARFRSSQNTDGGWGYHSASSQQRDHSTATMTCAGLLGLAVAQGVAAAKILDRDPDAKQGRNLANDQNLKAGLAALTHIPQHPIARNFKGRGPRPVHGRVDGKSFYFLWSLERVAVALGLDTIGGKDWYSWGAEILLDNQGPDGSWTGNYPGADTCFALLFLKRANLAKDLTRALRGKIEDPGEIVLRSGGVGGERLNGPSPIKTGLETEKSANPGQGPKTASKIPERKDDSPAKSTANPSAPGSESARLARELVQGEKAKQERALERLREGKGVIYTEALALAIPQLEGDGRRKARQALAERLARLKEPSLGSYLKDEDVEIRRAAALACAMKDAKGLVPNLIPLLDDREMLVKRAALLALNELTGKNLGESSQAWQEWWNKQKK